MWLYSALPVTASDDDLRYRCAGCGNLTRFDVVSTRRARRFIHQTLGGEPQVEEEEVLTETIEDVVCRWCGSSDQIERVPRVDAGTDRA